MANTAVKDVSSLFLNRTVPVAGKAAGGGDFQKVWNRQLNKGLSDSAAGDSNSQKQNKISEKKNDGFQEKAPVKENDGTQSEEMQSVDSSQENGQGETVSEDRDTAESGAEQTTVSEAGESENVADDLQNVLNVAEMSKQEKAELPDMEQDMQEDVSGVTQEQLLAMEILGTAAAQLMEQIADVFEVTVDELQSVMDNLEMEPADLLDASKLGNLLLELGGAKDAYALITDGTLYDNYRMIMGQLDQVLRESAGELMTEPEQLPILLKDSMQAVQEAEASLGMPEDRMAGLREGSVTVTEEEGGMLNSEFNAEVAVEEQAAAHGQDTEGQERSGRQSEGKADGEDQLNLIHQDFRTEQFRPEQQQVGEIPRYSSWSTDTRQIMNQILDYMKLSLSADTTSLEMQLHPASLGTLHVQIASRGGIVTANFITENEAVKTALESQMLQLREQFEEQGVKVEAIEVTVQTHEFEQNLEQGRGRSQQEGEKRGRSRRFRMNRVSVMSAAESDDAAAADRIAADGSTVSYTA